MEPRISIVTLGVTDLPRSVQSYRVGLGLILHDEDTESIAFLQTRAHGWRSTHADHWMRNDS